MEKCKAVFTPERLNISFLANFFFFFFGLVIHTLKQKSKFRLIEVYALMLKANYHSFLDRYIYRILI